FDDLAEVIEAQAKHKASNRDEGGQVYFTQAEVQKLAMEAVQNAFAAHATGHGAHAGEFPFKPDRFMTAEQTQKAVADAVANAVPAIGAAGRLGGADAVDAMKLAKAEKAKVKHEAK